MRVDPMIAVAPIEHFVPVLREIELLGARRGSLASGVMVDVMGKLRSTLTTTADDVTAGAELIQDPARRAVALEGAAQLRIGAEAAAAGRSAAALPGWVPNWMPLPVPAGRVVPHVSAAREAVERGARLLRDVPEVGTPPWVEPTAAQARRASELIDVRRAGVLEELGSTLTRGERAQIDAVPTNGRLRQALSGPTVQRLLRTDVLGADNVTAVDNAILAPVHMGTFDPLRAHLGHRIPHRIMAADFLWTIPGVGNAFEKAGAFPVTGGASASSMRVARGVLAEGQRLLMYPSGSVPQVAAAMPSRRGAAVLAIQTGTPIVPAGEFGTAQRSAYGGLPSGAPRTSAIAFGEAIPTYHLDPDSPADVLRLTARIDDEQQRLSALAREHVEARR